MDNFFVGFFLLLIRIKRFIDYFKLLISNLITFMLQALQLN
jgi:hypothetical protein